MRRLAAIAAALVVALAAAAAITTRARSESGTYTIRAIFDDASYAATGEDVRIAGANVGSITSLGVNSNNRAAVTLSIDNADFIPFYANAHCTIRPQSLIGEQYVNCSPGTSDHPQLDLLRSGPGKGDHFLPVTRTSSPIDADIVQNISRMPVRQSLSVVLDELGTGLATRGSDLNAVIRRANPALGQTDKVFRILASQNHQLARLADDSRAVLAPLAAERNRISSFVKSSNSTSVAAATRAQDEFRTFHLFPTFLGRLRPLLADLGALAGKGTPVLAQLGQTAAPLGREFGTLAPFATQARTSLIALGQAAQQSEAPLVSSLPLVKQLKALGSNAKPSATSLDTLLKSLDSTGGFEQLMTLLYNATQTTNGLNSLGHYARVQPLALSTNQYSPGCNAFGCSSARFSSDAATLPVSTQDKAVTAVVSKALRAVNGTAGTAATVKGLLSYLTEDGR